MAAHTPGPWEFNFVDYGEHEACEKGAHRRSGSHFAVNHPVSEHAGLCVLCSAPYGNLDGDAHPPTLEDARLIAAAPELLDALIVAKGTLEIACGTKAPYITVALDIINAAIAKAAVSETSETRRPPAKPYR